MAVPEFVYEDRYFCDRCKHCDENYGNAQLMVERGEEFKHDASCPLFNNGDNSEEHF